MPKISVLLPVYNTDPGHLRSAIDSVLSQTFTDFELIIYNDASPNSDVETTVQSYNDQRIVYTAGTENLGISKVRNKLIDLAKGEYLAVMDHDDLCLPTRFEKQVTVMDGNPEIGVCGTAHRRFGHLFKNKTIRYPSDHTTIKASLFFKNVIHHPSAMLRKKTLIDHNIGYDGDYISANDRKMFMDIAQVSKAHNLSEVLCLYRLHKNMTSKTKRDGIKLEQYKLRDNFLKRMGANLKNQERETLNNFVLNGRARIKNQETLNKISETLIKLSHANHDSKFFGTKAFDTLCAKYLIKRCHNAAFYSGISSKKLLETIPLPIHEVKKPLALQVINYFK